VRRRIGKILLVTILIGLILPALYITASSLAGRTLATPTRDYRYTTAQESSVNVQAVQAMLASLAQTMNPDQLNLLRGKLAGLGQSPARTDPLGQYIGTLLDFSTNMDKIQTKLVDARSSLASGNTTQAASDFQQLTRLTNQTKSLLQSLTALLDRVTIEHGINSTVQQQKLDQYGALLKTYSGEIDQVGIRLREQQGYVPTKLTLNASMLKVFINQSLFVEGSLKDGNGTALPRRNVTITWGVSQTILKRTDFTGRFEAYISFPIGFSSRLAGVEADFTPQGNDTKVYIPSTVVLCVEVAYEPTRIVAKISPASVRPLDTASVEGNLSTQNGVPLKSKTIAVQVDGVNIGNITTSNTGSYSFAFSVPQTLNNGTHALTLAFPAVGEAFASSNATLPFVVEIFQTQSMISTTGNSLFSGMSLAVNGSITYVNGTALTGTNATIFLDGVRYAKATVGDDGSFRSIIQVPIWTSFGGHSVTAEYVSDRPWVQSSEAVASVFIYNTPFVILAAVLISAATSAGFYLSRRSRGRTVLLPTTLPEPVVVEKPTTEELPPEDLISAIEAENLPAARIRKSYMFAQIIINQKIGASSRTGETHWEYYSRVTKAAPQIRDTLKRLVELYELAEYTEYPIEPSQSREASEILLELREEIETVK
jgi:hypothetical protein